MSSSRCLALVSIAVLLAACSSAKHDEYKNAKALPPLEVPPDLINPPKDTTTAVPAAGSASAAVSPPPATAAAGEAPLSPIAAQSPAAAPPVAVPPVAAAASAPAAVGKVHLEREGAQRWLVVPGTPVTVFPRVHEFLVQEGYEIAAENAAQGTLETEWRAAAVAGQDKLDVAAAAALQNKFRLRLEAGRAADTVEISVSHLGLQRLLADGAEKWQPRPADPQLEAELLSHLQDYFANEGAHGGAAADLPAVHAEIVTGSDSVTTMRIPEDFERAWRRVGLARGRGGFVIEDRNRDQGVYLIKLGRAFKEDAKAGFFSRLFGANAGDPDAQYRVFLKGRGNETVVTVQHPGGAAVRTSIGERILDRLKEKME